MNCPRCTGNLKSTDFGEYGLAIIDVCPDCQGSWFDSGELDRLDDSVWTDVENIDFSDVEESHKNIPCPKCDVNLEPLSPMDAKDLIVDRCPSCQGFWLDKGELDRMKDVAAVVDSEIAKNMKYFQPPPDWSGLRWFIYCFKECYSKKK